MNSQNSEEQITLSSSAFDQLKDDEKPTTVTHEIAQSVQIKEQLKLIRIFDKKYLNVNEKTSKGTISYFFRLSILNEKPVRKRIIKFSPLLSGIACLAGSWFLYLIKQSGLRLLDSPYTYTVIVILAAIGLILLVYVVKEFRNVLVFKSEHGKIPVVELLYRVPNKTEFNEFVSRLIECIKYSKQKTVFSQPQLLAAELSEHRKLRDSKAISNKLYEAAKKNIMALHG